MARILVLFVTSFWIAALNLFTGSVTMNMRVPNEVNAGKEFIVDITLKKAEIENFARFQQELPSGLSVEAIQTSNADFRFEDNKVKFVWLQLPANEELNLIYKVKVNERLKGKFKLGGKFSYIENNERKHINLSDKEINIQPNPSVDPNLLVDVNDYKELVPLGKPTAKWNYVSCIRQKPVPGTGGQDLRVNLLVSKGNLEKFAKIEETIPAGFRAESIESKEGIFTFKDQVVKFLWMNLPADQNYIVSYKLIPEENADLSTLTLAGSFSYIDNEQTQTIDIKQYEEDLLQLNANQISELASRSGKKIERNYPVDGSSSSYTADPNAEGAKEIAIEYKEIKSSKTGGIRQNVNLSEHKLNPENGVYYRVQIAAGHRLVNVKRYFKKYKFKEEVKTERLDGWIKYSVGSFVIYKEARDYRNVIWHEKGIKDAFVSAYNNGQRITVQEALMISNQKWYK